LLFNAAPAAAAAAALPAAAVPHALLQCWQKPARMHWLARAALLTALLFSAVKTARR
jgi:hypothetical protein